MTKGRKLCRATLVDNASTRKSEWDQCEDSGIREDIFVKQTAIKSQGAKHTDQKRQPGKEKSVKTGAIYTESINIQPTNGGVAPLYKPLTPS